MKAQTITPELQVELIQIGNAMDKAGLSNIFVASAVRTAFEFEGVYDLMSLWMEENDKNERGEIVADIQDMIDDCSQTEKIEGVYVRFDDLDGIAKNVRAFKDNLRMIVDNNGGVTKLSELTGIPQPSVSRFFSSNKMPRRATLLKIARALKLNQVQIATEWSA